MSQVKRFQMKKGTTLAGIEAHYRLLDGGEWINPDAHKFMSIPIMDGDITVNIGFPDEDKFYEWDDIDYVLVFDEDFGQPYGEFYGDNFGDDVQGFPYLEEVIDSYNRVMSGLDFLEPHEWL